MNTNPIPQAPTGPAPTRAPLPAPDAAARAAWAEAFIAFLLHFASLFARTEAARPDPVQAAVNQAVHELCALIADYAATGAPESAAHPVAPPAGAAHPARHTPELRPPPGASAAPLAAARLAASRLRFRHLRLPRSLRRIRLAPGLAAALATTRRAAAQGRARLRAPTRSPRRLLPPARFFAAFPPPCACTP